MGIINYYSKGSTPGFLAVLPFSFLKVTFKLVQFKWLQFTDCVVPASLKLDDLSTHESGTPGTG